MDVKNKHLDLIPHLPRILVALSAVLAIAGGILLVLLGVTGTIDWTSDLFGTHFMISCTHIGIGFGLVGMVVCLALIFRPGSYRETNLGPGESLTTEQTRMLLSILDFLNRLKASGEEAPALLNDCIGSIERIIRFGPSVICSYDHRSLIAIIMFLSRKQSALQVETLNKWIALLNELERTVPANPGGGFEIKKVYAPKRK